MSSNAFVSVVTPVYNGGKFLDECIESVRAQSYAHLEHVILDNASSDDTHAIATRHAERDPRIRLYRNEHTLPMIDNWNRALELMSGDSRYCRVLHADDTMHRDYLERTVAVAERHPSIGIVGCFRLRGETIHCEGLPRQRELFEGAEIARLFLRQEIFALAPTSNLLRADLVRQHRPFYPRDYLHADLAIYLELMQEHDFGFVHDVLAFSREHGDSVTVTVAERNQTLLKEWLLLLQRYGPKFFSEAEMAELERDHLRRYYRNLVRGFVTRRGRAFFDYHLAGLKEAGRSPTPLDLLSATGREILAAVTHPGKLRRHLKI